MGGYFRCSSACLHNACIWLFIGPFASSCLSHAMPPAAWHWCGKVGRLEPFWFNQETYYRIISQDLEVRQHEDKPTQRAPPPASRFFARVPQWRGVSLASHIASGSNTRPMSLPFPHVRNVMFLALQDLGPHPKAAPAKLHWCSWVTCNHVHSKYDTSVSP